MPKVVIDIPVDIGTPVYEVHDACHAGYSTCPFNGGYGISRCEFGGERFSRCNAYYTKVGFLLGMEKLIGTSIFLTEQEAKDWVDKKNKR